MLVIINLIYNISTFINKINIITPAEVVGLDGENNLESIVIENFDKSRLEIKTDFFYPKYNVNNLYIPSLHSENTAQLKNINGDVYNWRIVAQNYSSVENDKIESQCKQENEYWNSQEGKCIEFEHSGLISYNNSEQFLLDIEYTKGEFKFILNPLDEMSVNVWSVK